MIGYITGMAHQFQRPRFFFYKLFGRTVYTEFALQKGSKIFPRKLIDHNLQPRSLLGTMAATVPFSLLRNYSQLASARALVAKANFNFSKSVLPLQCRRLPFSASASNNEQAAAKAAAVNADSGAPTVFDKIINKEIPSSVVYEDEKVLAFRDIDPQAPVHVLVIPKFRDGLTELGKADARHGEILGQLLYAAKIVAEKEGILDGFRVVINSGPSACQTVYHLHLHVLGGRQMTWPPG